MNNTSTKLYIVIAGLLGGLIVLYFLSSSIIPKLLVTRSSANMSGSASLPASYLLGGKILCKADGIDKCVVNMFVVDADNKGVLGKVVKLSGLDSIVPAQVKTDVTGRAKFEMTSVVEGQFKITATVDGVALPGKSVTVIFRN